MEQIPSFNLLQAVDPTKIKVPISERFAKLTLSSNKKQQQKFEESDNEKEPKRQQERRSIVSRNISKQFDDENKDNEQKVEGNPLLRSSESLKDTECNVDIVEETEDLTMEPLEVSQDCNNPTRMEGDIDLLSQQMASMAVKSKAISISSGSTGNISVCTKLDSLESQCSGSNEANKIHIIHHIPINMKDAVNETIYLNATSSTEDKFEKSYETASEDDGGEEDEIITVSDISECNREQVQDIMATSNLSSMSLASSNIRLPSLKDNKAERVAAFLRDVSIEQRAMLEQGYAVSNDTIDKILDNNEIDKIQETIEKSRQIAAADTESMTPDLDVDDISKTELEREKRLESLEQLDEKKKVDCKNIEINIETENNCHHYKPRSDDEWDTRNVHRLANDDTQDNTLMTEYEDENNGGNISKIHSNLASPLDRCSPKTPKGNEELAYRMAADETQCNTELPFIEETPKAGTGNISYRLINLVTEENAEMPANYLCPNRSKQTDPRRLANQDTLANSLTSNLAYDYSQDNKTPKNEDKTHKNDDTANTSSTSIPTTPQSSQYSDHKQDSYASIINTSPELNATRSEHSITILETDEEDVEQKSLSKSDNDKKLSNSFQRDDSSDDSEYNRPTSQIQMSMPVINISAKINIKIRIPNTPSTDTSEDDQNYKRASPENEKGTEKSNQLTEVQTQNNKSKEEVISTANDSSIESNDNSGKSDTPENVCNQMHLKVPMVANASSPNKSLEDSKDDQNEKFLTESQKLLNQLYGNSWQTPEVIRTLKYNSQSVDNQLHNSKFNLKNKSSAEEEKSNNKSVMEDTIMDDFSIFRRNIVKTNLDSTRLATPKLGIENKQVLTEPRNVKKPFRQGKELNGKLVPQTERKQIAKVVINKGGGGGRVAKDRWRQLIDDDNDDTNSEVDDASDDEDADESWSKNASDLEEADSSSESDVLTLPKARNKRGNKTIARPARSNNSDYLAKVLNESKADEIVYLDLSKDEVEVQDEVSDSPPANHDVAFTARLQEILRACTPEPKSKLPQSSKNTKRKLFTPNFGDHDFENVLPIENESKNKENTNKRNDENYSDDGVLEDNGNWPFDSRGRPLVFNKQLESVKKGKLIFPLTPSPKPKQEINDKKIKSASRNTPKADWNNESKFKTPTTAKSKGPAKELKELCKTPVCKYSFLKSLDVTVSRVFCHPDALYYRDNYRTKKEDLSKILYDLYNEKLFRNELDVSITWNKKLLNTAGRCLNRKTLGKRSSVVQLSDKVLTSADRLRCTLIHELCHAATWIFNGEGGHGSTWKEWARKANETFPELPKIGVCHQYDIEYKYTYKCTLCGAKSHAHSKSKKVENIRCSYCHGAIEVFLNKKDKDGNVLPTPVKGPTGFAKFVKENYKKFKRDDLKHADVMKLLSSEFAALKVAVN